LQSNGWTVGRKIGNNEGSLRGGILGEKNLGRIHEVIRGLRRGR